MLSMIHVVEIASVILSLVLLWSGLKRADFTSFVKTLLTISELAGLGLTVRALGWWGLVVFAVVNAVAVVVWSVILAARVESKLVYAGIQTGNSKEEMQALAKRLGARPELKPLGPVERAELIRLLAERNRSIAEIELMAAPIAQLKAIHDVELAWLVDRFDQILRLAGEPVDKADEVAATIHATATNAAATFRDIVDALVTFYGGDAPTEQAA